MTEERKDKPKIIVDEDWKSRIEAEKEEARQREEAKEKKEKEPAKAASAGPAGPLPPPSLGFLCGSFYLQAMIALGVVQNPLSEKAEVNLEQAKHAIDMLAMLREKTEGNRTDEETTEIDRILHELRMGFVSVEQQEEKTE